MDNVAEDEIDECICLEEYKGQIKRTDANLERIFRAASLKTHSTTGIRFLGEMKLR